VFVEPQPGPFQRLRASMRGYERVTLINAAVDETSGSREFYTVLQSDGALPAWTEQLGSFDRNHLVKHEDRAPGLSARIVAISVPTMSFTDVLLQFTLTKLDLLQIDAEGMDAKLLDWFPFEQLRPQLVYFENAHMSQEEHQSARSRLRKLGYTFCEPDESLDDMAVLF
jgi:FkbM family methyltransferase